MARVKTTQGAGRTLFSWRDSPLPPRVKSLRENRFRQIDFICEDLADLPSMRGLIRLEPRLQKIPIDCYSRANSWKAAEYEPAKKRLRINFGYNALRRFSDDDLVESLLSHEYRHAYQHLRKCMDFTIHKHYERYPNIQIAFDRVTEADATVFSIVLAYEAMLASGRRGQLEHIQKFDRGSSVRAYLNAVSANPMAHWNGAAASAAFRAYFGRYNSGLLKTYDLNVCKRIKKSFFKRQEDVSESVLAKAFKRFAMPMSFMPYEDDKGILRHRFHYREPAELTAQQLLPHFSREVRQKLLDIAA